ncbi:MAG: sensor histidine kinase, partial [Steroidobacteraceae bacterium]
IRKLRPVGLDELGLQAALEHSLDHWQQRLPAVRFAASFEGDLDALGEQSALVLYRLVQEGLTNLSTHARARSVRIRVARTRLPPDNDESIVFEMTDDGCGADLSGKQSGLGLIGMRERVEMLGGRLRITTEPAKGFSIVAHIPLSVRTAESS